MKPTKSTMTVLKQAVELIPAYLVPKLARKHGVDKQSRSFSPWSHVVSQVHTQLAHSLSLNDVCDDLCTHSGALSHMRLDLQTFLPRFALVKAAGTHDSTEAPELCADIRAGEVVVFDKAYVDFSHLHTLTQRDVFWVTRAKDNMAAYEIVGQQTLPSGPVLLDALAWISTLVL